MKSILIACLILLAPGLAFAEARSSASFLGEDVNSQKAQDFYRARCEAMATDQGIQSGDRQNAQFLNDCIRDMSNIWPLGYDESED